MCKTVSNFAAAKYGTISIFVLTCQNSLKFCGCKIWDHFNFCRDMAKQFQFLQLQNMWPFQFLSWCAQKSLKFCSRKLWDRFDFWPYVVKWSQFLQLLTLGLGLGFVSGKMVLNFAALKYGTVLFFVVLGNVIVCNWESRIDLLFCNIWNLVEYFLWWSFFGSLINEKPITRRTMMCKSYIHC